MESKGLVAEILGLELQQFSNNDYYFSYLSL